jgi:hypothetical protein
MVAQIRHELRVLGVRDRDLQRILNCARSSVICERPMPTDAMILRPSTLPKRSALRGFCTTAGKTRAAECTDERNGGRHPRESARGAAQRPTVRARRPNGSGYTNAVPSADCGVYHTLSKPSNVALHLSAPIW